ncbi:MAG: diguanylate cyclase [Dehalococcoidia bacterium]|nr:diguanylate cyclase [Dehalococcoidia bacterium]
MSTYIFLLAVTLIVYLSLVTVILRDARTTVRRRFAFYLICGAAWSLSTLLAFTDAFGLTRVWTGLIVINGMATVIAYYSFVRAFVNRNNRSLPEILGYAVLVLVLIPLVATGHVPQTVSLSGGGLHVTYGPFLYLIAAVGYVFFILSVIALAGRYRSVQESQDRNKTAYLLAGLGVLAGFALRSGIPPVPAFPYEQIGHLGNALVISYAITRHRLLDVRLVLRKGLAYSGVSILITSIFLLMLVVVQQFVRSWTSSASLAAMFGMAVILAWAFNPMRGMVQKLVDRAFYGEAYDYRQLVLTFSKRMGSVIELRELAEAMLQPIVRSVRATQVSLLMPANNDFISHFAERLVEAEPLIPIKLSKDSPIVKWLDAHHRPLSREIIDIAPEFKGLCEAERNSFEAVQLDLLLPMVAKERVVAVLALSKKESGGIYSADDVDLLTTLTNEAAVALENAQLYAQARDRAHLDELTGLFNHRYFHERLDEEISRSSRFGDIFSLLFLDLDLFKIYNDVYGHLAGDDILKQIGHFIKSSIRSIDIAYRYGGDEFTIILPQASLDDALTVAERIRKKIESEMDARGVSITCSIGIASWPTDGVLREELFQAADAALYHSKQTGRNRITLAPDVTPSRVLNVGLKHTGEPGVLSTIYALAATVDAKDHYTYGHSKKVSTYATDIAEAFGYSDDRLAIMRAAALLHDIGKIGVSDGILVKSGKLDSDDWEAIRAHPKLGVAILKHVEGLSGCLAAIQYHHERYDGSGYPAGLKGENIPLDARILAVADSFDAMTSLRPYRPGKMTEEEALLELIRCRGTQFDPRVVDIFVAIMRGEHVAKTEKVRPAAQTGK